MRLLPTACASLIIIVCAQTAHGGDATLDSVVTASQSGIAPETILLMTRGRTAAVDHETCVRLLRAGVAAEVIAQLTGGAHPTDAALAEAARPGPAYEPGHAPPVDPEEEEFLHAVAVADVEASAAEITEVDVRSGGSTIEFNQRSVNGVLAFERVGWNLFRLHFELRNTTSTIFPLSAGDQIRLRATARNGKSQHLRPVRVGDVQEMVSARYAVRKSRLYDECFVVTVRSSTSGAVSTGGERAVYAEHTTSRYVDKSPDRIALYERRLAELEAEERDALAKVRAEALPHELGALGRAEGSVYFRGEVDRRTTYEVIVTAGAEEFVLDLGAL